MNKAIKNLLMNLYFLKQLLRAKEFEKATMMLENESGLDKDDLIEDPTTKTLEEAVSNFTMALAQLNENEDLGEVSEEYVHFFKALYYSVVDLQNGFVELEKVLKDLSVLFEFPLFEATLLHYVQNEMIKDKNAFNNVVLSTYIHIAHIKFLALIDEAEALNSYIYEIGIDIDQSTEVNLDAHEVLLLQSLEVENKDFSEAIINYFNSISNEVVSNNLPAVISSCEYVMSALKTNLYIKNII